MNEEIRIQSKILVHEADDAVMGEFKAFFAEHNLIGMNAIISGNLIEAIKSNIDLGAIILSEENDIDGKSGIEMAIEIHKLRQELPIFLRRKNGSQLDDLPVEARQAFAAAFPADDISELSRLIERYIFNTNYPNAMIRGIQEISNDAIRGIFSGVEVTCSAPYLVNDRLIYGQLFTLMPLDGDWARGYLMFQTEEESLLQLISSGKTALPTANTDFHSVNSALGELTNLVWGGFKARFFVDEMVRDKSHQIQVPIIVNHEHKYITFGSMEPQLCFQYTLTDNENRIKPVTIYQKFVFNLFWSPEAFKDQTEVVDDMMAAGELELF